MQVVYAFLLLILLPLGSYASEFTPVLPEPNMLDPHLQPEMETLVTIISQKLLGLPYVGGKLGEGNAGIYDQDPLYRLDSFDCTTFVETVLANALCNDERHRMSSCLEGYMQKIRYFGEVASFETRNHIAEADWIPNMAGRGFLRDVTQSLGGNDTKYSHVRTDKKSWFESRTLADIQTRDNAATKMRKLSALRQAGIGIEPKQIAVPYLGFNLLFLPRNNNAPLEPNIELYRRLPNGAVFNIVRENWNPSGSGTPLAISHQGFILQKSDGTYLRHASTNKSVLEVKLGEYMSQYLNSETVRGINVLQILPKPF